MILTAAFPFIKFILAFLSLSAQYCINPKNCFYETQIFMLLLLTVFIYINAFTPAGYKNTKGGQGSQRNKLQRIKN